jgi:hypothetical protein
MRLLEAAGRCLLAWTLLAPASLARGAAPPTGPEVEAVYLFNFASFVEWPASAFEGTGAPFGICVLGEDPFGHVLDDTLAGETVAGRRLVARRIARAPEATGCHILFVAAAEARRTADILHALDGRPILTVSEVEAFTRQGGMVTFVMEHGRVRFQVNVDAVTRSGLVMSSQLLRLARTVDGAEESR